MLCDILVFSQNLFVSFSSQFMFLILFSFYVNKRLAEPRISENFYKLKLSFMFAKLWAAMFPYKFVRLAVNPDKRNYHNKTGSLV